MGLLDFFWKKKKAVPGLKEIFQGFQEVLSANNETLAILADLEEKRSGPDHLDLTYLRSRLDLLEGHLDRLVSALQRMSKDRWPELEEARSRIQAVLKERLAEVLPLPAPLPQADVEAKLEAILNLILPLNLMDSRSPYFRPENCRTYHDIIRFAHIKSNQVIFGLMDQVAEGRVPALRLLKLKTTLPLNLHLVDLGGGLASHESPVPPEDILSRPMRALWRGISHPDISWAGPVPVDMGGFLHVLGQAAIRPPENFWDKTYAVVAANNVIYACRLGYHFSSVASYCGPVPNDNYIHFTFKGGAADEIRRIRRIQLIAIVLKELGFEVDQHQDVIQARFRKHSAPETEERLDLLGRLMAYVRQMDMLMANEAYIHTYAERFLAGHYERPGEEEREER
jgi:pyruvate,water dikinase